MTRPEQAALESQDDKRGSATAVEDGLLVQRSSSDEGISFVVGPWGRLMHVMPALRITDGDREESSFQGWDG